MSTSTDGILFWGIAYSDDEGDELPEDPWQLVDEAMAEDRESAIPEPTIPGYQGPEWDEWREKVRVWDAQQCVLDTHCSGDYPMYYIAVQVFTAHRGYPVEIGSLEVDGDWRDRLKAFCARFGFPWREPKWWLVSYWSS